METNTLSQPTKYDPGSQVTEGDHVCLHRNENLFIDDAWGEARLQSSLRNVSLSTYPDPTYLDLRTDLAALYNVEPRNVFVGNGSDEVLADLLALLRERYDSVHLLDACFRVYYMLAARLAYRVEVLPGETFLRDRIEADGAPRLAVVDSPNAITGRLAEPAELRGLAEPEGSFLIWDNAYGEYSDDGFPVPWATNVVLVRSFSKFYGLAGARLGYCIADADLVSELMDRKDVFNVNVFAQTLAREALRRRPEFLPLVAQTIECRELLVSELEALGFAVHPPSANYVLATHPKYDAEAIRAALLERGIAVRRFDGPLTGDHIRITVPRKPVIEHLIDQLTELLEAL